MKKNWSNYLQLLFVSVILLITFGLMMAIVIRNNFRWDFTEEKIYSLSDKTKELVKLSNPGQIDIVAFYPQDDTSRDDLEMFLQEVRRHHPHLRYEFFDPDRSPQKAKDWKVRQLYTTIIQYNGRQEKVTHLNEELFATAILKLMNPKDIALCFVVGHDEASIQNVNKEGIAFLRESLEDRNFHVQEIPLKQGAIPETCQVTVLAGPQTEITQQELGYLEKYFNQGGSLLFLIDPVDSGTGVNMKKWMEKFGVDLGQDVVVDKMSREVGGDFLVTFANQYAENHPVTEKFELPTFLPVARSVTVLKTKDTSLKTESLAFSSKVSWAETNLAILQEGTAVYEEGEDIQGPVSVIVAVEKTPGGRMIVVGDSDFLTNAYILTSANKEFILRFFDWLSKDDRKVKIEKKQTRFEPLVLNKLQRIFLLVLVLGIYPLFFLLAGGLFLFFRRRGA